MKKQKKIIFTILVIILFFLIYMLKVSINLHQKTTTFKSETATPLQSSINTAIQRYVKENNFSGTILVAKNEKTLFNEGYGYAKGYWGAEKNTPATRYFLGSITKTFTSSSVLKLADEKLISLDDSITKYLPEYTKWQHITIRNLLNHTSGIENYYRSINLAKYMFFHQTSESIYSKYKDKTLEFEPGTDYDYSNTNYAILSKVIEIASKKTYKDYLQKDIFATLEMKNTGYEEKMSSVKNHSQGHVLDLFVEVPNYNLSNFYGSGCIYSTTEDLLTFCKSIDENKMIIEKIPTVLDKSKQNIEDSDIYGYGLETKLLNNGKRIVFHTGCIPGFSTGMYKFPEENMQIIILSNNMKTNTDEMATTLSTIMDKQ